MKLSKEVKAHLEAIRDEMDNNKKRLGTIAEEMLAVNEELADLTCNAQLIQNQIRERVEKRFRMRNEGDRLFAANDSLWRMAVKLKEPSAVKPVPVPNGYKGAGKGDA